MSLSVSSSRAVSMMIGRSPAAPDRAGHVQAVEARQAEVEDDEVRALGARPHEGLLAGARLTTPNPAASR